MLTYDEVMAQLKKMGTAQNVKIYKRHGMSEPLFGVSFANLNLLKKQIKSDHALAKKLWMSGNADARNLATMIADPAQFTSTELDEWAADQNCYGVCDLLAGLVSKTTFAQEKTEKWIKSTNEWIGRTGWNLIGAIAMDDSNGLPDSYFEGLLERIEKQIHHSKNFTKHSMNGALIGIGIRNAKLKKIAQAAARRIGKVDVDHGETCCQTPDAFSYIEKAFAHREAKRARSTAKLSSRVTTRVPAKKPQPKRRKAAV